MAYHATLSPLNASVTGSEASGEATFTINGDDLTIHIEMKGVPPDMAHLQHFHGFAEGDKASACPTAADDKNGDGIIDLVETEPVAGTTMVPFNDNPLGTDLLALDTFPKADANGTYTYETTVSLKALEKAFAERFPGQQLDLDRRVIFVHSIPDSIELPSTVQSLGDFPASLTLPIACGKIEAGSAATPQATPAS
ncbi:MAG: CHRD domain-containing protein [Thermomicrobiales bacterium]|nr:CHRD domain-containing protein [Thermomicrobiales bacterium]